MSTTDFEMKYFQNELAQRPVNRSRRPWTFFLAKIMPQIDSAHSKTLNMHLRAVAGPSVFFPRNPNTESSVRFPPYWDQFQRIKRKVAFFN